MMNHLMFDLLLYRLNPFTLLFHIETLITHNAEMLISVVWTLASFSILEYITKNLFFSQYVLIVTSQ